MIDHTGFRVRDPVKSRLFYEKALAPLGYQVLLEIPREHTGGLTVLGYGVPPKPDFWIAEGAPNEPRIHVAFRADKRQQAEAFYDAGRAPLSRRGWRAVTACRICTNRSKEFPTRARADEWLDGHRSNAVTGPSPSSDAWCASCD